MSDRRADGERRELLPPDTVKRLLLFCLLICTPLTARAESCTSSCSAGTPCNANSAGSWTGCTLSDDDTWTIRPGDHMVITADITMTARLTIASGGSLAFDPTAASRTNGILTLTINTPATDIDPDLSLSGTFILRAGDHLAIDTSAPATDAVFDLDFASTGILDAQGFVYQTTIAAMTAGVGADGICGSGADSGRLYQIVPASGLDYAKDDRRIVFQSGKARTQHMEIIGFADTDGDSVNDAIQVCTHLDSALSAGQRLDLHGANANAIHNGSYDNLHTIPIQTDETVTTDSRFDPAVGDEIAIVDDWWIYQSAGTGGIIMVGANNAMEAMPDWRAGMIANIGDVGGSAQIDFATPNSGETGGLAYMNIRDWQGSGGVVGMRGIQSSVFEWNYFHSATSDATGASVVLSLLANTDDTVAPNNNTIRDNRFVRVHAGAIGIHGNLGEVPITGIAIERNFVADGCNTSATASECVIFELNGASNSRVVNNVIFNFCPIAWATQTSEAINWGGATVGNELYECYAMDNWVVNVCGSAFVANEGALQDQPNRCTFVHNYASHLGDDAAIGAHYYSNLIKNWGYEDNSNIDHAIFNPIAAYGNFLIGADPEVKSTGCVLAADCVGSGDPDSCCTGAGVGAGCIGCGSRGIYLTYNRGNSGQCNTLTGLCVTGDDTGSACATDADCGGVHVEIHDNILASFHHNTTGRSHYLSFVGQSAHFDVALDHETCDGHEESQDCVHPGGVPADIGPQASTTWNFGDILALADGNRPIGTCFAEPANFDANWGVTYSYRDNEISTWGGTLTETNCNSSSATIIVHGGNLRGPRQFDYQLLAGAPELTAGSDSGAVGSRVWRFDPDRLNNVWGGILTFDGALPPNFCNSATAPDCEDPDQDGIVSLHDNCDLDFNPSQYDDDGDGNGRACESCTDLDGDGFGAPSAPSCAGGDLLDCDDLAAVVFPGAPEVCDGIANDCNGQDWPVVPASEVDDDLDGFAECEGDCDDGAMDEFPGNPEACDNADNDCDGTADSFLTSCGVGECAADGVCVAGVDSCTQGSPVPEVCDGLDNDCNGFVPVDEVDNDGDGFRICDGDCDDTDVAANPGETEVCDSRDNDCDGMTDEDQLGEDPDMDGIGNLCDNCPQHPNPGQTDTNVDGEGDSCDLDDGLIYIQFDSRDTLEYQLESAYTSFNIYRSVWSVFLATGLYTQDPTLIAGAERFCNETGGLLMDSSAPPLGDAHVYFASGVNAAEGSLGTDSNGNQRPNLNPCP